MKFNVRSIGCNFQEMYVDEIHTGTLSPEEAKDLAEELVSAAEDLLCNCGESVLSDLCGNVRSWITGE